MNHSLADIGISVSCIDTIQSKEWRYSDEKRFVSYEV